MTELSFKGRQFKLDKAEDAKEICDAIRACADLDALRLEGNTIGAEASRVIADELKLKKDFKRALWSDMYTGRMRSEIPPSLEFLSSGVIEANAALYELDLSDNAFGPDGVKGIRRLLVSPSCYFLHTLKLNNNGLGIGGGKILSEAFLECHASSTEVGTPFALKVFISGRNRLEDPGAKDLSKAFKVLGSLEEITMPQNGIRPSGVAALAEGFLANKNLKILNINDNTCTLSGAQALAKCIPHLRNLETLNVGDCLLKDSGASVLAPALAVDMPALKEVIMSFNEIRTEGAVAVAASMKNKTGLTSINLDGNQLGDAGVEDVTEKMSEIGKLDCLAPFDDNEDPDSDDDDEDEDGAADSSTASAADDSVNEGADDLMLQIKGMGLAQTSPQLASQEEQGATIEDVRKFVQAPSLESWKRIGVRERKDMLEEITKSDLLPDSELIGKTFVRACDILQDDAAAIADIANGILATAFADPRNNANALVTSILVNMGLLKGEEKLKDTPTNLKGPLVGLDLAVKSDLFPRAFAQHFIAFLMKPNSLLDSCQSERHTLLQKLHKK